MWQRIYPIKQSQGHTNEKGQGKSSSSYVKIMCLVWPKPLYQMQSENPHIYFKLKRKIVY